MSKSSVRELVESVSRLSALYVGETIIDEYCFVKPLARPSKESILAVEVERVESFQGGVVAAFRHAESFCRAKVSTRGEPIKKTRYVEENYSRKLFEVQYLPRLEEYRIGIINLPDVLALCDFGHGLLPALPVMKKNPDCFIAIACQTNAANAGFNLITKYGRADYIVIDEPEARLAAQDRHSDIREVIRKLADGRCSKFVVTLGNRGAIGWDGERFHDAPAFTGRVVDTMGAGDAFFAVTAPMAMHGAMEDLLVIGNAAGALKTQILGHRESVTKPALLDYLDAH